MAMYLTRIPILNRNMQIYGYELKTAITGKTINFDPSIINKLNQINNKKLYINFRDDSIKEDLINNLPRNLLGIEIPEGTGNLQKNVYISRELKKYGFSLMVGEYIFKGDYEFFLELADIVKINNISKYRQNIALLTENRVKSMATGLISESSFNKASGYGFTLFKGDYIKFAARNNNLPASSFIYLNLLQEINKPEPDFEKIENTIKNDISLSYNLFRLINSAYFGLRHEVKSIKQALVLLGLNDYKKWLSLKIMRGLAKNQPDVFIYTSLIRANFAEYLSPYVELEDKKLDLFLVGLFSMLDIFLGRPLPVILSELPIDDEIYEALINQKGVMGDVFKLLICYEKGNWQELEILADKLNLLDKSLVSLYLDAVADANEVIEILG